MKCGKEQNQVPTQIESDKNTLCLYKLLYIYLYMYFYIYYICTYMIY
jgi:hypothetical protein